MPKVRNTLPKIDTRTHVAGEVLPPLVWTTRDGRRVKIKDMTDDHLENTIMYIRGRMGTGDPVLDLLRKAAGMAEEKPEMLVFMEHEKERRLKGRTQ